MNKIRILMIMTLIVIPVLLMSVEYDLNNYEVPDYTEFGWDLYLDNSGSISKHDETESTYFSGRIRSDISEEIYTRENYLHLRGDCNISKRLKMSTKDDSTEHESRDLYNRTYMNISALYRRYLIGNWFAESSLTGNYIRDYTKWDRTEITYDSETVRDGIDYALTFELGSGFGRIEKVTRARQALYILEELEKAGLLIREAKTGDVTKLADLLVSLKHLRIFDSRLKQQEDMRLIVNYLKESGFVTDSEVESLIIIDDLYKFGAGFERRSGWDITPLARLSLLEDEYHYDYLDDKYNPEENDYQRKSDTETATFLYGAALKANYLYNFGKDWQLETICDLGYFLGNSDYEYRYIYYHPSDIDTTLIKRNTDESEIALEFDFKLNWFPNTRTQLGTGAFYSYNKTSSEGDFEYDLESEEQIFNISAFADYYISPRFLLYFSISAENIKLHDISTGGEENNVETDLFNVTYKLNFSYDLF